MRYRDQWSAVVLTGGGWPGDYDIVRALGHAGIFSAVASSDPRSIAFHSRFTKGRALLPPFAPHNDALILRSLALLAEGCHIRPVLYYVGDSELLFTARYRSELARYFRFLLPESSLLEAITDKALFHDFATKHRLPVPHSIVVRSLDELQARMREVTFPCIVKPPKNTEWFWESSARPGPARSYKESLRRISTVDELLSFCRHLPDVGSGVVVQKFIDGSVDGTVSFLGYFDEQSRNLGSFVGTDLRTYPPYTGDSTLCEMTSNRELTELSTRILSQIRMKGIVKIDYAWDSEASEYKILEIEPHFQVWHLLGAYGGVNLAATAYYHQRNEHPSAVVPVPRRKSLLYLWPDLKAYWRGYRKSARWPLLRYLRSILKKNCHRILDLSDLRPFGVSLLGFGRRVYAGIVRDWSGRRPTATRQSSWKITAEMK